MDAPQTKVCTKCGEEWLLSGFPSNRKGRYGLSSWCRLCHGEAEKAYRARKWAQNPDGHRAYVREAVRQHRERTGNVRGKEYNRARSAAMRRLAKVHPDEFERLLTEELDKVWAASTA